MTKQLGVGLYGAGNVVQEAHAPAVNAVAATRLAAVCDIDEARAKALADKYGGANVYADYARMLADPAVDIIIMATPNNLHRRDVEAAAKAGKHVLCEKPLAITYPDALEMVKICERHKVVLKTGFNQRYLNQIRLARLAIEAGLIGEVYSFRTVFSAKWDNWVDGANFRWDMERSGGATTNDNLIHRFDMLRYLLKDDYAEVVADVSHCVIPPVVDDNVHVMVRTNKGARGSFIADRYSPVLGDATELYGTKGSLSYWTNAGSPFFDVPLAINTTVPMNELPEQIRKAVYPTVRSKQNRHVWDGWLSIWPPRNEWDTYAEQLAGMADEILNGVKDGIGATGMDGARATELVHASYSSQIARSWVAMPLADDAAFAFPKFT
ncbi:MAG: Gfo/Idh/MocA family protein [Pseudomonadota bacterium]